jgi:hypothetical protein
MDILKQKASNLAVRLEVGRLPVENFITSQTLLYFTRLYITKLNPLLKESFLLCQNLDSKGIYLHMVFISIKLNKSTSLSLVLALFLALYKDIQVSKYVTSELYVIIGLTNESKRLLATFTGKLFNEVV